MAILFTAVVVVTYFTYEGSGDPVEGIRIVGRNEDDASKAIGALFEAGHYAIGYVAANTLPEGTEAASRYIVLVGM